MISQGVTFKYNMEIHLVGAGICKETLIIIITAFNLMPNDYNPVVKLYG